tara:strand:- start:502 stop:963 length:462 start_codon:yes stop_codon:yes gene_type:complete
VRSYIVVLLTFLSSSVFSTLYWEVDFSEALKIARKQEKPILLYFCGSDWCGWCIKLNRNILQSDAFEKELKTQLIFATVDFPSKKLLPHKIVALNRALKKKYSVIDLPTILLIDTNYTLISEYRGYPNVTGRPLGTQINRDLQNYREQQRGYK